MSLWTRQENDELVSLLLGWALSDDDAVLAQIAQFLFDHALPPLRRSLRRRGFSRADAEDIGQELLARMCDREGLAGLAMALGLADPAGTAWADVFGWTTHGQVSAQDVVAYRCNYIAKSLRRDRWNEISAENAHRDRSLNARAGMSPGGALLDSTTRIEEAHEAGLGEGPEDVIRIEECEAEREEAEQAAAAAAGELTALRWICARVTEILETVLDAAVYTMVRLKYLQGHDAPQIADVVFGSSERRFADRVRQALSRKVNQSPKLRAAIRAFADQLSVDRRRIFDRIRKRSGPGNDSDELQTLLTVWGRTEREPTS